MTGSAEHLKLSIVIVNHNGGDLVLDCLDSLRRFPAKAPHEVIVIDNQSVDESPRNIAEQFPEVRLISMGCNAGLTRAFNHGVGQARGEFVLALDNDTTVASGALDAMIEFLEQTRSAGACGAKLLNPDGSGQQTARRFPRPSNAIFGRRSLLTRWFPRNRFSQHYLMASEEQGNQPYQVDSLSAACLMVRQTVIEEVGPLDEDFFVYWCDTDWCFRIKQAGWEIFCLPRTHVIHHENLRSGHRQGRRLRGIIDFHKGAYRFYRKHYIGSAFSPMNAVALVGLTLRAVALIVASELTRWFRRALA